jgi:hypothetical protein
MVQFYSLIGLERLMAFRVFYLNSYSYRKANLGALADSLSFLAALLILGR